MKIPVREAAGYAVASACALAFDMATLWVLVNFFRWNYLIAATVSFSTGTIVAYVLSVKLIFEQRRVKDRRLEFASFAAIGTAGLIVNAAVIFVCVRFFGVFFIVAKCIAAGFTLVCNFICRRQLLFVESPVETC